MDIQSIKKQITEMDVMSDDFYDLYKHIADKYHDFEKPDTYQSCVKMIYEWMSRSCNNHEDQVIVTAKVVEQVFLMRHKKTKSCTGTLAFTDESFFFDIYTSETEKDKLSEQLLKAHSAMEKGNFTVNGKKDKFGKKYFSKDKGEK